MTTSEPHDPYDFQDDDPLEEGAIAPFSKTPEPKKHLDDAIKSIREKHPDVANYLKTLQKRHGFGAAMKLLERMEAWIEYKLPFELNPEELETLHYIVNKEFVNPLLRRNLLAMGAAAIMGGGFAVAASRDLDKGFHQQSALLRVKQGKIETHKISVRENPVIAYEALAAALSLGATLKVGYDTLEADKVIFEAKAYDARYKRAEALREKLAPAIQFVLDTYREKMELPVKGRSVP